jgi:hypothetical protein
MNMGWRKKFLLLWKIRQNLNVITTNLKSIESYECFGLEETCFQGIGIVAMFFLKLPNMW